MEKDRFTGKKHFEKISVLTNIKLKLYSMLKNMEKLKNS
jgi:hypothetical protein